MAIGLKLITAADPLWTAAQVRDLARLAGDQSDASVLELLAEATAFVEGRIKRSLLLSVWRQTFDCFPADGVLRLIRAPLYWPDADPEEEDPFRPEVYYADPDDGTFTLIDYATWHADQVAEPPRIVPAIGEAWPSVAELPGAVRVVFWAGYGPTVTSVPAALRRAVLTVASHWYEHPEALITGTIATELAVNLEDILGQFEYVWEAH